MGFDRNTYRRLMDRIDIVEIISKHVDLTPRTRGKINEYLGLCPFHRENHPSFSVTRYKQFYHCHGCGATGNAVRFLQKFLGLSGGEAVVKAAEICGIKVPQGPSTPSLKKLQDRKKYKRKMAHRQQVVHNRTWNIRRKSANKGLLSEAEEDDIPF